jgi:oxalate decarboxylase/phosphoglucose isomerase-like protein (cupin superfamily)
MREPQIIQLPKITDPRGNLTFLEGENHIPFPIARTFWIYDVPGGETRGGHAYKNTQEFIIALSGSFDVVLHDGRMEHRFSLNRSYYGLYVPAGTWRHMENFSTNALALVLASTDFDADDYERDFNQYLKVKNEEYSFRK